MKAPESFGHLNINQRERDFINSLKRALSQPPMYPCDYSQIRLTMILGLGYERFRDLQRVAFIEYLYPEGA